MTAALEQKQSPQPPNAFARDMRTALEKYPDCQLINGCHVAPSAAKDAVEFIAGDGGRTVYPIVRVGDVLIHTTSSPIRVAKGVGDRIGTGLIRLQEGEVFLRNTGHCDALIETVRSSLASQPFQFCYQNDKGTITVAGASQEKTIATLLSTSSEPLARLSETNALARLLTPWDYEFLESLREQLKAVIDKDRPWKTDLQAYPEHEGGTADFLKMVRAVAHLANSVTTQPQNPILQEALNALQSWPESSIVQQLQGSRTLKDGVVTPPKWYDVFTRPVVWCVRSKTLPVPTTPEFVAMAGVVAAIAAKAYLPPVQWVMNRAVELGAAYPPAALVGVLAFTLAPIAEQIRMSAALSRLHASLIRAANLDPEASKPVAAYRLLAELLAAKSNNFSIS